MAAGALQAWLDASSSPSWQRALKLLGQLLVEREASIHPEEVDEELVEAMGHIMDLLRPLAVDDLPESYQRPLRSPLSGRSLAPNRSTPNPAVELDIVESLC